MFARSVLAIALLAAPQAATAQSLLDRTPNVSGNWVGAPGALYFHFVHRFSVSDAPERKVSNVPTFLVGAGLPKRFFAGFNYSTNSTLAPDYPNEWEAFARWAPLSEDLGAPLDFGAQAGYNNAADGVDGEVSIAKRLGIARLIVAGRALSAPLEDGKARFAIAVGSILRLSEYVALAGDIASLTDRDSAERMSWSAGLHVAIPLTPHTFSLHASNALITTLQGASRGSGDIRYGFEFTIPLTLRRYFGKRADSTGDTAVSAAAVLVDTAVESKAVETAVVPAPVSSRPAQAAPAGVRRTTIRNISYMQSRITVSVGTTVEWKNGDPLPHTVTANDKSFDSGLIQPGKMHRHTFTRAGTFNYHCVPHPFMKGVIVVTP